MYGKQTAVTAQQAYESSRRNGGAGSVLTQEQFTKAFNTGRSSKDARIQNSAARQRGEGKVYFGQDVDYGGERYKAASEDMVSSAELDVIKTLAKITGTDVVFYQSEADMSGRYKGANGFMRNGTMYLDVNAGANRTSEESAVLLTAAHELTHYIRENNAEGYAQLRDFVTRHLIEDGADIEALAEQKAARENGLLSMDEAVEEVIADSCEMMLEDTQLPEIMAKENPGLYEQIREWIANFAEKLRKAFTGVEARHAEAKAMMQYADELQQIWDSALAGAVRNAEAASGSEETSTGWVRNSNRDSNENTTGIKEQIEENRDRLNSMEVVATATVPTNLGNFDAVTAWAMKELKRTGYAVDKPGFGKIIFDERQIRNGVKYAKTPAEKAAFAVLDKVLKRGVEIGAHGNHKNREKETVTFAAPVELNGIRGNMAVVVNRRGNTYYAHRIVLPDGTEFRFTEKKNAVQGPKRGVTAKGSLAESTSTTFANTIPQSGEESNTKYSMRESFADYKNGKQLIKSAKDRDRVCSAVEKKLSEMVSRGSIEDFDVDKSRGMGSYETFYIRVEFNEDADGYGNSMEIRFSGHNQQYGGADVYMYDGGYAGVKELTAAVEKEIKLFAEENGIPYGNSEAATDAGKTKYSLRERDEDLQKKYPRLNLNEDISDLDGVPAIELTDGSILPIKDRERYRTHVSFIEGNRIDVDDLRSGGWIGNGVYDASFTSDTARYIEQQQAKKRVAELRGVPYDQFGDGNTRYSMRDVAEDDTADERRGRQESYAELRRQNEELRRRTEYWKGQTRTTKEATVRKTDTDAFARRLTEELHNKDAEDTVKEELKRMGDYIVQTDGQELSYAELKDWAAAIADHILSGSEAEIESGMEDARRELLDYLKSNKLKINEREMLDLPEGWKREHRRIRFGKEGLPIDTAWMELQEKFGEGAFPSTITSQSDMLFHIADMERAWQPVRGNPFENYMGEMRETVAQDILDTMLSDEIRQTAKTAADRARDRMNKAVAEERTRYNDMKSRMQERIQQVYQEGVARKQEAVAKEKAAKWEEVEQTRNYYQQMMQNAQQRRRENAGFSMFAHQNRVFFVFSQRKPPLNKTRRPQGLRVISSYSSHFHVIALITRLTDREALAGKYAVFAHIIKQLVTAYAAVYEAYSVVLLCKLPHGVLTVYVIHSYSRMRCDIPIYKALQHLCFKSVNEKAAASRSAHIIHFSAAASRKLRFQSAQQIIDIRIEEHTVYRLKVHALVMYVYKLSQSILCFRGAYERRRSLCRGERMVAVSHGKKHPLPLFPAFLRKRRESGEYAPLLILGNEPAAKVPAAEHKVKIIELRELRRVYAFYYLPALIVHEDHDMRQLQRSIPADIDARRYA